MSDNDPLHRAPPPWWRPAAVVLVAALALGVLGRCDLARRPPPRLLLSDGHAWDYVRAIEREVAAARSRVWVVMFVVRLQDDSDAQGDPVRVLMQTLADAAARGVDVRVCLDLGEVWGSDRLDQKHLAAEAWLREHGVHVVVDERDRTTHAKVLIIDSQRVILGSHNWTRSAVTRNRETSLLLHDADLARQLEREVFATIPGFMP